MKYVFEGEDLSNVLRENEIRIKRGTLKVYPLDEDGPEDAVDDTKEVEEKEDAEAAPVADCKDVHPTDTKRVVPADKKKPKTKKK